MFLLTLDELSFPCSAGLETRWIIRARFVRKAKKALGCLPRTEGWLAQSVPLSQLCCCQAEITYWSNSGSPIGLTQRNLWIIWVMFSACTVPTPFFGGAILKGIMSKFWSKEDRQCCRSGEKSKDDLWEGLKGKLCFSDAWCPAYLLKEKAGGRVSLCVPE